jgi:hypothetical protein
MMLPLSLKQLGLSSYTPTPRPLRTGKQHGCSLLRSVGEALRLPPAIVINPFGMPLASQMVSTHNRGLIGK